MAQYLKDEVHEALLAAALEVFALKGFRSASMAEIASAARVSTGNIYRYFENKSALYAAVVPNTFVTTLQRLLRQRVEAARGVGDLRRLEPTAPYRLLSEEVLAFCLANRLRVVVLLSSPEGTPHERFAEELVQFLVSSATSHFHARPSRPTHFALEELYRNYVATLGRTLRHFEQERDIRQAVEALSRYHLTGLAALFEP
ncbi:helix-turn-helix domain-containing protein [Archangium sp.]|uniref:helix-turn-helix domain-containing protein n=1 Tax=Archangium sp. TaxID=1872627 RepID=UPI002D2A26B6|nr:helix-turn-helix domain-containing protein [Archangium sp.]HYO58748.1 helix-turn-helix domain-containing protein [Archangium sp.]